MFQSARQITNFLSPAHQVVVLDEADTMFDRGFGPEVRPSGWFSSWLPAHCARHCCPSAAVPLVAILKLHQAWQLYDPHPCSVPLPYPRNRQVRAVLKAVRSKATPARCVLVSATMSKQVRRLIGEDGREKN